ncbi:helix-turn-helix domain-containing protein [Anaerovorax odorimutans]|uniref:Helix-turn-helix domain-containing protein n=1 Tax=Anaerovorax odorimutans TaxID=109327 RepID=A0ABT1RMB5_9FIRM|nr:helix-turn-helix domain-containing protein [Anaerovorax odorimutans]MCQ4636322.1 helix-turn-helix domain-containing protein [Anaerovorax odorimutans]
MSFIISDKQHLASAERRSDYKPFKVSSENCQSFRIDVNFGHPLYTSVSDIFAVKCGGLHNITLPVVPDGCISMAFYGMEEEMKGKICGVIDEIKKIELKPGELLIVLKFQPSATASILKDNASSLTNKVYDIKDYIKNGGQIVSAACKDLPVPEKAMLLSKLIRVRMKEDDSSYLIRYCTDRIYEKHGNIKVSQLGTETGYSERYLGKVFEKYVGVSPKIYCEIMRLQNSLQKLADSSNHEPLINLALDSGFFDHAHMNRCYKRFLHCSSGTLRKLGFSCLDYNKIDPYLYIN